jgi:hypothetical protein
MREIAFLNIFNIFKTFDLDFYLISGPLLSSPEQQWSRRPTAVAAGGSLDSGGEEACRANVTAQAGMTARLFCCLARRDSDLGVRKMRCRRACKGGWGGGGRGESR